MTLTGELTDFALMTEGAHVGRYAARIYDKPYPVMAHVDPFLLKLQKGWIVDVNLKDVGGEQWISKIARSKDQAKKPQQEIAPEKPGVTDIAGDAVEKAKARAESQAAVPRDPVIADKLKKAGFDQPDPVMKELQVVPAGTPQQFNKDQISLIKATVARNCTDTEFELLMYLAAQYHLDPIRKQIWAVKYGNAPASIFTGRDGFLEIAHRSGQFDGMESGIREEGDEIIGWCKVYRKDMSHAFYVEVFLEEYQKPVPMSGKPGTWQTMPKVMIQKVAESSCLRRAFSVSGLYCPEEMPDSGGA
jgi:phage recombination protein Bet